MDFDMIRVIRGRACVNSTMRYEEHLDTVEQVLLDLLHYCNHRGINFQEELNKALALLPESLRV